ncbi:unnamed protein product, partial [Pocillopora meandrina]
MAIANSTEDGNHTITKSSVALQFLEQLRTFSFQLWIFHYPSLHLRFRRFIRRRNICSVVWRAQIWAWASYTSPTRWNPFVSRSLEGLVLL